MNQLYERGADAVRIGNYVRRCWQWVRSGLEDYDPTKRAIPKGWLTCLVGLGGFLIRLAFGAGRRPSGQPPPKSATETSKARAQALRQ